MAVILTTETIKLINLFESITHVPVKDCLIENNTVYFLVEEGTIKKAIGNNGISVKTIEALIKRHVRIYEYSRDLLKFIKNLIPQARDIRIKHNGESIIAEVRVDNNLNPMVIGREGRNIKVIKEFLKRNHNVKDLLVK